MTRIALASPIVLMGLFTGCGSDTPKAHSEPLDVTAPTTTTSAPSTAAPVRTSSAAPLTSAAPPNGEHACVMLYECGCNASCVQIDHGAAGLSDGERVEIRTGDMKGTRVFVKKTHTPSRGDVFTVQRADPSAPYVCRSLVPSPLLGYLCATSNMGDPRACDTCPE
jgi:hypothetical protein